MKCDACNVHIACRTTVCPLCRRKLCEANSPEYVFAKRAFPLPPKTYFLNTSLFDVLYVTVALFLSLVAFVAEIAASRRVAYAYIVVAFLFYLYFLIRGTIQNTNFFTQKVLAQALALTAIAFSLSAVLPRPQAVFEYVLPSIYLASILAQSVYIFTRIRKARKHLMNLLSVALLAFFPFAVVMISPQMSNVVLNIVTASVGGLTLLGAVTLSSKKILQELKKVFDI